MKSKKPDFAMTFYRNDERIVSQQYIRDTVKFMKWVEQKVGNWTHCMIYDRHSGNKLARVVNNENGNLEWKMY